MSLSALGLLVVAVAALAWALVLRRRARDAHRALEAGPPSSSTGGGRGLRASERRYRQLVESADDLIYRTDAEGRFNYVNPAVVDALGFPAEELLERNFREWVRPDYQEQARRFYEDQRRQGIPNTYCEFPMLSRTGQEVWLGQRIQLGFEGERFTGFLAVARDITDRRLLEQALEREREQLRQIVTHAPVAMAMLDREGRHLAHSGRWLRYVGALELPSVVGPQAARALARHAREVRRGLRARPRGRGGLRARGRRRASGRLAGLDAVVGAPVARLPRRGPGGRARGAEHRPPGPGSTVGPRGLPTEVGVRGQHEPRDPHSDERGHRDDPPAPRHRPERRAARVRGPHRQLGARPPGDHQRHPRLLEDRGRPHRPGDRRLRPAASGPRGPRLLRGGRPGEGAGAAVPHPARRPHRSAGRSRSPAPGADQPRRQRGEVHREGRGGPAGDDRGCRRGHRERALRGPGHRHRHRPRAAAAAVRVLRPGRRLDHPPLRRHRARAGHLAAASWSS